jgi:hypothetical protein
MTGAGMRDVAEVMRDEMAVKDRLLAALSAGPQTIPQLAATLGYPSHEVLFWVMALWRYGTLEPAGKADAEGYYRYQLTSEHAMPAGAKVGHHGQG